MAKINIGRMARWLMRQSMGVRKANPIIECIENLDDSMIGLVNAVVRNVADGRVTPDQLAMFLILPKHRERTSHNNAAEIAYTTVDKKPKNQ